MEVRWLHALSVLMLICIFMPVSFTTSDSKPSRRKTRNREFYQRGYNYQRREKEGARYPDTGNLLLGREHRLTASSTCGLYEAENYCIVSHLEEITKCFLCNSTSKGPASHTIDNIVSQYRNHWWQAQNGVENVHIQLDLEAEFHFTHLIIVFKTFRPAAMLIERSYDFGKTWKVYRYFADNCAERFPGIPQRTPQNITDVVCESRYSDVSPSSGGEIIFRVLPPNIKIEDPYSDEVQNMLKITNLRLNFTKLHTLGDDLLDTRNEIKEKYYYAIFNMVVRGSCSCHGHASQCLPLPGIENRSPRMVHGRCECTHHTTGLNCERCQDFYNDLPWKPAVGKQTNACRKCNCNEHASSCRFDEEVYENSGRISGGVCENCLHHTTGRHCEQCEPFYYQDPNKDLRDPEVCLPCNCDPLGSIDEGICDSRTDVLSGLIAGNCHCLRNVGGRRCDRCKAGFWNFSPTSADGCQPCTCNTLGTIDNRGCDEVTGECQCKRFVEGRDCNQCAFQYWGLSEDLDGCKACDCDPGGSYDNFCNVTTGQCRCRPHAVGRRCDKTDQGYFAGILNNLLYEAEYAGPGNVCSETQGCEVVIRQPHAGRQAHWTGPGFARVGEDSYLNFTVNNLQTSLEYDIIVRYEPQHVGTWNDVRVIVDRDESIDQSGPCANVRLEDDYKQTQLPSDNRYAIVYPHTCLEAGKTYKIRLEFKRYDSGGQPSPAHASILIDSIVLKPRLEALPWSKEEEGKQMIQEFRRYNCDSAYYTVLSAEDMSDVCQRYHHSIGFYVFKEGQECNCDPTGSNSTICNQIDGQCQCKSKVVGRRCDRCSPGHYGFGPEGCTTCECNNIGSLNNFCDDNTGQCNCRPNTYGQTCDQCQPGFWNFPNCIRCDCNGHADTCDQFTGHCNDCRDHAEGVHCERCLEGFYGDPRLGINIPCKACPCPGTAGSGHSFADRCYLDDRTGNVVCQCQRGYKGARCDVCDENFFGDPNVPGGGCQPCNCSNNVDPNRAGNCDPSTGECLQCIFDTEGFYCERCRKGFYGDAINRQCRECHCDGLGTNPDAGFCDHVTGQCKCYANVIGQRCDRCEVDHWKIASGSGCEPCNCDPFGSYSSQCNEFHGKCNCTAGFGGDHCDQCKDNYWGDPRSNCYPCSCSREGSLSLQCAHENGSCPCIPGVGGDKCDRCARGYLGQAPQCEPCGECFDNWDRILSDLREKTLRLIEAAADIKQTGATGAYTKEFQAMEKKLNEIREILHNATVSTSDLDLIETEVQALRNTLKAVLDSLDLVNDEVDNTTSRVYIAKINLVDLQNDVKNLTNDIAALKEKATSLQEAHLGGALNLTREALKRSEEAERRARDTGSIVQDSQRQRLRTERLLENARQLFLASQSDTKAQLDEINDKLISIEKQIPELNGQVCGNRGDPCDALCGGAGCGRCGGLSCDKGAVTRAETARTMAEEARDALIEHQTTAEARLREVTKAKNSAEAAHSLAEMAHDLAMQANATSHNTKISFEDLLERIIEFLDTSGTTPAEIRILAEQILEKQISLKPEKITELSIEINEAIASLTDIDSILADTRADLYAANQLKERADRAKLKAEEVLETANAVVEALQQASDAQVSANDAIRKANDDVDAAHKDLVQINSETEDAQGKVKQSMIEIQSMEERVKILQGRFTKNDRDIKSAATEAHIAQEVAKKATEKGDSLEAAYVEVSEKLDARSSLTADAQARASALQERANRLAAGARKKLQELQDMEKEYVQHELELRDQSALLEELHRRMSQYLEHINHKADIYRKCHR